MSDACASYADLDELNTNLTPSLKAITQTTDFFAYYRLNLFNRICPFWSDSSSMCGNIACAVHTIDNEEDIPEIWRAEELGKLEGPKAEHPGKTEQRERLDRPLQGELGDDVGESCVVEYDDECDERDYCVPEDERATAKGDYVSLVDNPERFTGYGGTGARQVWDAIYRENCFSNEISAPAAVSPLPSRLQAVSDIRSVMSDYSRQQAIAADSYDSLTLVEDECLEKRVFHRVISGMHASISTHICWDYLNQTTGTWGPNLQCYEDRLQQHPERISNIYFNYALLLRAVIKLRSHLQTYTFCTGDVSEDSATKAKVLALVNKAASAPPIFDESSMFADPSNTGLKQDFRNRFRNVSRMMDCVGCDKCRLWGKLQTAGYGTALKVLFEYDDHSADSNPFLRRTELVALINTLDRVSSSLLAIANFQILLEARDAGRPLNETERNRVFDSGQTHTISSSSLPFTSPSSQNAKQAKKNPEDMTFSEIFNEEIYVVWKTFLFVLRSWIELPGLALKIGILEISRLWDAYLGLPVRERTWEIRRYVRDEL